MKISGYPPRTPTWPPDAPAVGFVLDLCSVGIGIIVDVACPEAPCGEPNLLLFTHRSARMHPRVSGHGALLPVDLSGSNATRDRDAI